MRKLKTAVGTILFFLLANNSTLAKYAATEMLLIPWGDSTSQLPIKFQHASPRRQMEGDNDQRHNYPGHFFVDRNGILYIGNQTLKYIKAFNSKGTELFTIPSNYTKPERTNSHKAIEPKIGEQYNTLYFTAFCVDSRSRIYIQSLIQRGDPGYNENVIIADSTGKVKGVINSQKFGVNKIPGEMKMNSLDVLTFGNLNSQGIMTYRNGILSEGGYDGWLGPDDYYYTVRIDKAGYDRERTIVEFTAIGDSTNSKIADDVKQTVRPLKEPVSQCELLGIADDGRMFIKLQKTGGITIQVYDKQYTLMDEIEIPHLKSKTRFNPYRNLFAAVNGDIYEFHCLSDGLHIIKWSK